MDEEIRENTSNYILSSAEKEKDSNVVSFRAL